MRSYSTNDAFTAIALTVALVGCQPSQGAGTQAGGDTATPGRGAVAGPVAGDSAALVSRVVDRDSTASSPLTLLTIQLTDAAGGAPPSYVLIVAPDGKQAGMARGWATAKQEIAGATYNAPAAPETNPESPEEPTPQLMLSQLVVGRYSLLIGGAVDRPYHLAIRGERNDGPPLAISQLTGRTLPAATDTILIDVGADLRTAVATRLGHK